MKKLNSEATLKFNYQELSPQKRNIIQRCTGDIKARLRRTAQDVWEIGKNLVEVRSQLQHGQFDPWLLAEFGWSRRTAYNFINVYEAFRHNANFAQLDIATSALYKLAAPSTSESVRQEFLRKAQQGEKITHKLIHKALKQQKKSALSEEQPQQKSWPSQQILKVIPQSTLTSEASNTREVFTRPGKISSSLVMDKNPINIESDCWYLFDQINFLFCGDTASNKFSHRSPEATLALAITNDDWDHDWLIEKANNLILLPESYLKESIIEQTISLYSSEGDTVIMPWLPHVGMLAIAHRLKRRIVAGDRNLERCHKAVSQLGITVEKLNL